MQVKMTEAQKQELVDATVQVADRYNWNPEHLLTIFAYETGTPTGVLGPWQKGPTTKWGTHRGLIQWGEPQALEYGVTQQTSIKDQVEAAARYMLNRGARPGDGLLPLYATVNAGAANLIHAKDEAAGGMPGTVKDKVNEQMDDEAALAADLVRQYGTQIPSEFQTPWNDHKPAIGNLMTPGAAFDLESNANIGTPNFRDGIGLPTPTPAPGLMAQTEGPQQRFANAPQRPVIDISPAVHSASMGDVSFSNIPSLPAPAHQFSPTPTTYVAPTSAPVNTPAPQYAQPPPTPEPTYSSRLDGKDGNLQQSYRDLSPLNDLGFVFNEESLDPRTGLDTSPSIDHYDADDVVRGPAPSPPAPTYSSRLDSTKDGNLRASYDSLSLPDDLGPLPTIDDLPLTPFTGPTPSPKQTVSPLATAPIVSSDRFRGAVPLDTVIANEVATAPGARTIHGSMGGSPLPGAGAQLTERMNNGIFGQTFNKPAGRRMDAMEDRRYANWAATNKPKSLMPSGSFFERPTGILGGILSAAIANATTDPNMGPATLTGASRVTGSTPVARGLGSSTMRSITNDRGVTSLVDDSGKTYAGSGPGGGGK